MFASTPGYILIDCVNTVTDRNSGHNYHDILKCLSYTVHTFYSPYQEQSWFSGQLATLPGKELLGTALAGFLWADIFVRQVWW